MGLSVNIAICLVFCCVWDAESRESNDILTVPNGAKWGDWGQTQFCASGHANAFAIKVQEPGGIRNDDTGLNGIRLFCKSGETIESTVGNKGEWSKTIACAKDYLSSFVLNVEGSQGMMDDTGVNNIQFKCQSGQLLKGEAKEWGKYGAWSQSCKAGAICGIQSKVEPSKDGILHDDTGLDDVKFFCCA